MPNKQIRLLGPHETWKINLLRKSFIEKTGYPLKINESSIVKNWTSLLVSGSGMVAVCEKNDHPIAMAGGMTSYDLNNDEKIFFESFSIAETPGVGLSVIRFLENEARKRGHKRIYLSSICYNDKSDRTFSLYERLGYVLDSKVYRKEF